MQNAYPQIVRTRSASKSKGHSTTEARLSKENVQENQGAVPTQPQEREDDQESSSEYSKVLDVKPCQDVDCETNKCPCTRKEFDSSTISFTIGFAVERCQSTEPVLRVKAITFCDA